MRLLYGEQAAELFARTRVIIFGVGGVGSWCAEALVRTGIGRLTLVDADVVDITNINRQLPANLLTLGMPKAQVLAERFASINPDCRVTALSKFYDASNAHEFAIGDYDIVIDAIDSLSSKANLILEACSHKNIVLLSSMGAARRMDPAKVHDAEFWNVKGCPLARALRDRFKKSQTFPKRKFRCVYSDEPPKGLPKGTSMAVTATFGLRLAALAINSLYSKSENSENQ